MQHYFVPKPLPLPPVQNIGWPIGVTSEFNKAMELYARLKTAPPLACPASTHEIANGAFLPAASAASYITGLVLLIDGGWTARFARDY